MPVHIERSPVGAVLRQGLKDGFIDEEQYNRTIANQCAIMQYMKDTDNLDQFFAVSGAIGFAQLPADAKEIQRDYYKIDTQGRVAFTPYVSNSETQYATSFDVTTICRKTQTMIDVMCETMKRQHHGLTADEVVKIVYDNVYKLGKGRNDGGDVLVPCDVCYVFNRWVNLGKVFDTMRRMRDTYSDMIIEDIREEREKIVTDLCDFYRVSGNTEEYQTYKDGVLIKIEDYFDDTLFYCVDIFEDLSYEIIKDEEINFPYLFHDASAKFEKGDNVYILLDDEQIEDYNTFMDISAYSY
jgi:hypothetical protein